MAGSMDVPKTIPPFPSCDEHSELSDDALLKVGDQVTPTPAQFSLGSPSFEDLSPDTLCGSLPNGKLATRDGRRLFSKQPETEHTNRAWDPMNMRLREDPQNASSISYKPLPLETFACPSPQSNESSPFGFTMPITTGSSLTAQSCISKSPCACFSTLSHHLCILQATYSTTEHSQALDTLLIQSQQILPSIRSLSKCQTCLRDTQTLFLTHASICTCETRCISAEIRLGKFHGSTGMGIMVTRLLIRAYLAEFDKVVEVFGGTQGKAETWRKSSTYYICRFMSICLFSFSN
ncbi:hypothetical protein N7465_008427 [Penicillium sp. CMV-2018d]|nr:hypothetical protein N7465_008427 [Penicillium sp. CMV-2018d]